jgi:hypothetical protein
MERIYIVNNSRTLESKAISNVLMGYAALK